MNKEVAMMWVDALRSGEYPQTRGQLQSVDDTGMHSYCCLGVLCDLHRRRTNAGDWDGGYYETAGVYNGDGGLGVDSNPEVPTVAVQQWAGLKAANPNVPRPNDDRLTIAELNDDRYWTFGQLAALIEEKWEEL